MAFCGNCGTSVSGQSFCPSCGTQVGVSQEVAQGATPTVEQSLFDEAGIFISPSRFVSGSQTYAMSGVTSVGAGTEYPSKKGPLLAILIGAFIAFCGLITIAKGGIIALLLGAGILALGVMSWKKKLPVHSVLLRSASGEQKATSSTDVDLVQRIVTALNQAIVLRG